MRRMSWLLLAPVGCAGSDGSPAEVAAQFHARLAASDDVGTHALLTEADRAAIPLEEFPDALPPGLVLALFAWGDTPLDSAALLRVERDTAAVVLHVAGAASDTLRIELRVAESFTGARAIEGRIRNPTDQTVRTLRSTVRDGAGAEQPVEMWDLAPGSTTEIRHMTKLRIGPVTHRLERIQVF